MARIDLISRTAELSRDDQVATTLLSLGGLSARLSCLPAVIVDGVTRLSFASLRLFL